MHTTVAQRRAQLRALYDVSYIETCAYCSLGEPNIKFIKAAIQAPRRKKAR